MIKLILYLHLKNHLLALLHHCLWRKKPHPDYLQCVTQTLWMSSLRAGSVQLVSYHHRKKNHKESNQVGAVSQKRVVAYASSGKFHLNLSDQVTGGPCKRILLAYEHGFFVSYKLQRTAYSRNQEKWYPKSVLIALYSCLLVFRLWEICSNSSRKKTFHLYWQLIVKTLHILLSVPHRSLTGCRTGGRTWNMPEKDKVQWQSSFACGLREDSSLANWTVSADKLPSK